jgi:hypothetical protein
MSIDSNNCKMSVDQAREVLGKLPGLDDSTTTAGEAWEIVDNYIKTLEDTVEETGRELEEIKKDFIKIEKDFYKIIKGEL